MDKDKLIDYLLLLKEKLNANIIGIQEEIRLQREQAAEQNRLLESQIERMEQRAIAAEKREVEAKRRIAEAEKRIAASKKRIADAKRRIADAENRVDKHNATLAALNGLTHKD